MDVARPTWLGARHPGGKDRRQRISHWVRGGGCDPPHPSCERPGLRRRTAGAGDADADPQPLHYSQTTDVVVLDPGSGRTLWDLTDVVGQLLTAGGAGTLCVLTDAGADSRSALDGAPRWSITWPGSNASSQPPPSVASTNRQLGYGAR